MGLNAQQGRASWRRDGGGGVQGGGRWEAGRAAAGSARAQRHRRGGQVPRRPGLCLRAFATTLCMRAREGKSLREGGREGGEFQEMGLASPAKFDNVIESFF